MAVYQISLKDCLNPMAPPDKVLTVSAVDDTAFLYINKVSEDGTSSTQKEKAEIAVSIASLREALELLANDVARENLRPLDPPGNEQGDHAARLEGPRYGWVKL